MRTAIIGLGRMGRQHVRIAQGLQLDLVGIADRSTEALQAMGAELGLSPAQCHTDVESLLREGKPECVIIATHAPSHAPLVCQAAQAGAKSILCEKPMAVSLAECDQMLEACERHGARLAINHQMRFMPQYVEPKRLVNGPAMGGLTGVSVVSGNFGLAMNGTHYFEMFRYLSDEAPDQVCGWFSAERVANPRGPEFEDAAGCVRVTTASGKRFYLDAGADQGHGLQVIYAARNGQITVDELSGTMRVIVRQAEHRELPTSRYGMPADLTTQQIPPAETTASTRAVLEALLAGENYPCGQQGRLAVATLVAAYVSHESGHVPQRLADVEAQRDRRFPWA